MPDDSTNTVLFRMAGIQTAAERSAAQNPIPGLDRTLAEAMGRAAAALPGLALTVSSYETQRKEREVALSSTPTPGTILPLQTTGDGFAGAVIFDPSLTDALVEVQTLGRVERVAREARMPTRIDAALCRGFASRLLAETAGKPGIPTFSGIHPGRHLSLSAQLELEVATPSLIIITLSVSFAGTERIGTVTLLLPDRPRAGLPAPTAQSGRVGKSAARVNPKEVLLRSCARLEATLPKVTLSLGDLLALKVGDLVELPHDAVGSITLSGVRLGGGNAKRLGEFVIKGRLGQKDGNRAVKIRPQEDRAGSSGGLAEGLGSAGGGGAGLDTPPALEPPTIEPADTGLPDISADLPGDLPQLEGPTDLPDIGGDLDSLPDLGDLDADLPDLPDLPDLEISQG